jgi:hypothetical protein
MQIDPDPVILCVTIEEHAKLQQRIRAVLDPRHHASRREGGLFYVSVEVLGVLVQDQLAKFMQLSM